MDKRVYAIAKRVAEFLAEKLGSNLRAVILYGSQARGTATEDSDIDLLAVVSDALDPWQVHRSLDDFLFEILLETGELVSVLVVPQSYYEGYETPFFQNVRREGVRV